MPTYQYACTECGHALEAQQSFTDEPLSTCPECSGRLRKVFSAVGVVFKGSGFYRTDSRESAKAPAAAKGDSAPGASSGSSSESSSSSGGTGSGDSGKATSGPGSSGSSGSSGSGSGSSSSSGAGGSGSTSAA